MLANFNFNDLNPVQQQAVKTIEGPLLLLAGAGTGKTKTLTTRIAYLLAKELAKPHQVLALTFTNKAARELQERVQLLLGDDFYTANNRSWWLGTFHSVCLRILRKFYAHVGLQDKFIILDQGDSEKVLKQVIEELNLDIKQLPPKVAASIIARYKDKGINNNSIKLNDNTNLLNRHIGKVYNNYQSRLQAMNAVDFGDLLLLCVELFKNNIEILNYYQDKFRYIFVDEYQDTNTVQYLLLRALAFKHNNICCVGDDDQSIYSWRGAEIANILKFSEDYPTAKVLRLEQNYRSTAHILSGASALIAFNGKRLGKTLWTDKQGGDKILIKECNDNNSEAKFIVDNAIKSLSPTMRYSDMAVLVRAGYQTRVIEEKLTESRVPYKIIGGNKFYERLEIKDAIAYLRLVNQHSDDMAFLRIINTPKRGIGDATIAKIVTTANQNSCSLIAAVSFMLDNNLLKGQTANKLQIFTTQLQEWSALAQTASPAKVAEQVINQSGYLDFWHLQDTPEARMRVDNLYELVRSLEKDNSLTEFLERVALVMENDETSQNDELSLMTIHAAKGLEFNKVFLAGWEEGIFPSPRSLDGVGNKGLEEERRLAYVAMTRAKQELIISYCKSRIMYGNLQINEPSRFIKEVDKKHKVFSKQEEYKSPFLQFNNQNKSNYFNKNDNFNDNLNFLSKSNTKLAKGTKVNHIKFGYGVVKEQVGLKVTVEFEDFGEYDIMVNYLNRV